MKKTIYPDMSILIIDDEDIILNSFKRVLNYAGINNIILCNDSRKVKETLEKDSIQLILLDLLMPHISGEKLLNSISEHYPEIPIIIITGVREVETAIKCMHSSAFDYLIKPVEEDTLISSVEHGIRFREMQTEIISLKQSLFKDGLSNPQCFAKIITQNKEMMSIFQYLEAIASSSQPVLISGETGVGKELIAEAIHECSNRKGKFIKVSIAGLDETMFSDTLFGHTKGAFTGADKSRDGLIKSAVNGTLFLDEIGDLIEVNQIKLLRLLQEKEYLPLGSDESLRTNARIVTATNQNLKENVKAGKFRKDLYFRLRTHHIHIPALRERLDDLPVLIHYFLPKAEKELGIPDLNIGEKLINNYLDYEFPGNVRELIAMIYDDVAKLKTSSLDRLPFKKNVPIEQVQNIPESSSVENSADYYSRLHRLPTLRHATLLLIKEALKRTNGNKTIAANLLGITRQTIIKYLG